MLDPLLRNRVAIAEGKATEGPAPGQDGALAGIAKWANFSPEVDAKIREQIAAKVFPILPRPDNWARGEIAWLLDVIARNAALATAVLASFRRTVKAGRLFVHPIVRELVDPALLNAKPPEAPKAEAAARSVNQARIS